MYHFKCATSLQGGLMANRHHRGVSDAMPTTNSRRRRLSRMVLVASLVVGGVASTGCTASRGLFSRVSRGGYCDKVVSKYRNRVAAEKAWHCRKASFGAQASNEVFKAGFIDGYIDVAEGGDGCTPPFAPREYWGWRYQNAGGRNAVGSWFAGYPLGVQAAEEDGLGTFRQLPFCNQGCGTPACAPGATPAMGATGVPGMPGVSAMPGITAEGVDPMPRLDGPELQGPSVDGSRDDAATDDMTDDMTDDIGPDDIRSLLLQPGNPTGPIDRDGDGIADPPPVPRNSNPSSPRRPGMTPGGLTPNGRTPIELLDGPAIEPSADESNPFGDTQSQYRPSGGASPTMSINGPVRAASVSESEAGGNTVTINDLFGLDESLIDMPVPTAVMSIGGEQPKSPHAMAANADASAGAGASVNAGASVMTGRNGDAATAGAAMSLSDQTGASSPESQSAGITMPFSFE